MITAGIDIGSTMTKALILKDGEVISSQVVATGAEHKKQAYSILEQTIGKAKLCLAEVDFIVGTGYGRLNIPFADKQITEITCHARGVAHLFPDARTVIEIGGQDTKVIKLLKGRVTSFTMNDKCAAGTGRFLQYIADALELSLDEMNALALSAQEMIPVSNMCAVFAQHEIISALSVGFSAESVLSGMYDGFAKKIITLAKTQKIEQELVVTGGTSKHKALMQAFRVNLGIPVNAPGEPLLTGVLGAALLGIKEVEKLSVQQLEKLKLSRVGGEVIIL